MCVYECGYVCMGVYGGECMCMNVDMCVCVFKRWMVYTGVDLVYRGGCGIYWEGCGYVHVYIVKVWW